MSTITKAYDDAYNKIQDTVEEAVKKEAIKYIRRSVYAGNRNDHIEMATNLRLAKAALQAGGNKTKDYAEVLRRAYKGSEPLFDKVLRDFVKKAPEDQYEPRLEQAIQEFERTE